MRANINFCENFGKTSTEMLKLRHRTRANMSVSRAIVFKCHRRFKDDRQNIEDNKRHGREAVIHMSSATSIKTALEGTKSDQYDITLH